MFEKIIDNFKTRLTILQASYIIHFLMNQIGFGYEQELELYEALEKRVSQELEKAKGNT